MDAIVVGAGLAGLVAARDLQAAGKQVAVLEARERVGGRTWTVEFDSVGASVDLGAEWVSPKHHTAMIRELARYGLQTVASTAGPHRRVPIRPAAAQDTWTSVEQIEFAKAVAVLEADYARIDFERPDWHAGLADLDLPFADYLDRIDLKGEARERLLTMAFALMGASESEYSALHLLHEFAGYGSVEDASESDHRIALGAETLASRIAHELGDAVRLRQPVSHVTHTADGCRVWTQSGQEYTTAVVILAIPVNCLSSIGCRPPIDVPRAHAGAVRKTWLRAEGVTGGATSSNWPVVPETYAITGEHGTALAAFQLRGTMEHDAAILAGALAEAYPEAVFSEPTGHDWSADPYAMGTWCSSRPGQLAQWQRLADNEPPLLFAGGDISRRWLGWMDGAVTSGADAAKRAIAYLHGDLVPRASG